MPLELAKDDRQNVLQVASYETPLFQNIDGLSVSASTVAFTSDTVVRVKSYGGDNWITIGPTAVVDTGLLLQLGDELHMSMRSGDIISTIGGKLNIVPLGH